MKKIFALTLLSLVFTTYSTAQMNQSNAIRVVPKSMAQGAVALIRQSKTIKHFCFHCEDTISRSEEVKTVEARVQSYTDKQAIYVNGKDMDLTSVFIKTDGSPIWRNLAHLIGLSQDPDLGKRLIDVPETYDASLERNAYADPQKIYWEPVMPTDEEFFTSYYLALAERQSQDGNLGFPVPTIGAGKSLGRFGVAVKNLPFNVEKVKVKVTFQADKLADAQTFEETVSKSNNTTAVFFPPIVWNLQALRQVDRPFSTNFKFSISINDQPEEKRNVVVRVRSINDALYARAYRRGDGREKFSVSQWIFGAYVDEDHPWIDKLLKEALDTGLVNSFHGYQGTEEDVYKQLVAVWMMLQKRGFKYSSITDTSNASRKFYSQHVRLFEDSIATSQSNCVDGSVLWVSILKKIGIKAYLILIPGHCFIVIDPDGPKGSKLIGLETTMMGNLDIKRVSQDAELMAKIGAGGLDKLSINSFFAAVEQGTKTFQANSAKIRAFDETQYPGYAYIDIEDIRQRKIFPISR